MKRKLSLTIADELQRLDEIDVAYDCETQTEVYEYENMDNKTALISDLFGKEVVNRRSDSFLIIYLSLELMSVIDIYLKCLYKVLLLS